MVLLRSFPGVKEMSILFVSGSATSSGSTTGYVQASRSVSNFAAQLESVMRYYGMLIVPIGLSVLALGVGVVDWVGYFFSKKSVESDSGESAGEVFSAVCRSCQRNFVLLFVIWWILDMLFIWISPRSYVQYYLPLMASSAMLAAYVVFRCQKTPVVYLWLIGVWLVLSETISFLATRSFFGSENFWPRWANQLIPLAIAVGVYFFAKGLSRSVRTFVVSLACGYAMLCWSGGNVRVFEKRVDDLQQQRAMNQVNVWEQMGQVIQKNSKPDDGLYVWGWYPGIYVSAQRFSPASRPSYSDMHTDSPETVSQKINKLVRQLKKTPPKFIVDSRKMHYPYFDHPLFDLWPMVANAEKKKSYLPSQNYDQIVEQLHVQAEQATVQLLARKNRSGGALGGDRAVELSQAERLRHEAMEPLREFVIKNYKPVVPAGSPMVLFRYQPTDAEGAN